MRLGSVLALALVARLAAAQATDTTRSAPNATVRGTVRDSIADAPLAGAVVQLVPADSMPRDARTTVSDSLGRFSFDRVAAGHYMLGFFHPMLDSLGIEPPTRALDVDGRRPVSADLAIPSPSAIRTAICGTTVVSPSDAVVVGFVRDARSREPVANASVVGEWLEISIRRGAVGHQVPRLVATTGANGWFALCGVPSPGTILVVASHGADTTDVIELNVPANGLLHRELFVGQSRTLVIDDTTTSTTRRVHAGDASLSGRVVASADGLPVAGAQVGIVDGPQTRTNARGEWTLAGAPRGTRMLEVHALGYYPGRQPVDVVGGAAPVQVMLSTMRTELDTVKVNARRLAGGRSTGFEQRQRSGIGHYLSAADIERRQPTFTSSLFASLPGVRLDRSDLSVGELGTPGILIRGPVAEWCSPTMYIDGHPMLGLTADDLDSFVRPSEITGIEVYSGATTPPEFQIGMSGCGTILIWTNLESAGGKPKLTKGRIITGLLLVAFSVLPTLLLFPHRR